MVAQATLLLFGSFFVMLLAGVPISAGIGIASIFTALFSMDPAIFALTAAQRCFSGIDSFSLLALPFFSLGGNIMNKGGIAKRLVRLARLAVGKMPGYLAATNVLANMFFGAVSGSSVAATSAMGSIMAPLELDEGYDPNYSAAVNICSAPTGILIPPSGPLILYSITAGGVSVAALFTAGYLPGILWGIIVMVIAGITAKKKGYVIKENVSGKQALKAILDAIPSLLLIVIIIGGILGGVFTATEASAVAVAYATILGLLYKGFTLKDLPRIILESAKMTGIITLMIGLSSIMSWVMAFTGLPDLIANGILSLTGNKYVILILMNIILLIVGTFMDPTPAVLIFTPIFLPICKTFGMHAVQFGIMVSMNLCIGTITPPVGSILFTGCKVGHVKIEQVIKELLPYFFAILVALLLVTYIPAISMTLPTLAGLIK